MRRFPATADPVARFREIDAGAAESGWDSAVCRALEDGTILVHPTTSVYGIGGAVRGADAETARLKGRRKAIPILRLVRDEELLRDLHPEVRWNEAADRLAGRFWPGPLTLVFDDGTESGFAARAEAHPVTRSLLTAFDGEIGSTSLNRHGDQPAATLARAREVLAAMPEATRGLLLLAAGDLPGLPASTVVSLRGDCPRLLRAGAVSRQEIESTLGFAVRA